MNRLYPADSPPDSPPKAAAMNAPTPTPSQANAPITQDVLTIPRKLPEGGKQNLVGMTRD